MHPQQYQIAHHASSCWCTANEFLVAFKGHVWCWVADLTSQEVFPGKSLFNQLRRPKGSNLFWSQVTCALTASSRDIESVDDRTFSTKTRNLLTRHIRSGICQSRLCSSPINQCVTWRHFLTEPNFRTMSSVAARRRCRSDFTLTGSRDNGAIKSSLTNCAWYKIREK